MKTKQKRSKTHDSYNEGARDERAAILKYVTRRVNRGFGQRLAFDIIVWLKARTARFGAKKGGL
jgi:hypothetical protein